MDKKIKLMAFVVIFLSASSCRDVKTSKVPQIYHDGHPKKCEACEEIY